MGVDFNPSNLRRKSITRDMNGNIINWLDEADGGWIIRGRQIVNQAKYDAYLKAENDKMIASKAVIEQVAATKEAEALRSGAVVQSTTPTNDLEKRVNDMESKLDAILKAVNKNG
jgi:hypothetical protein